MKRFMRRFKCWNEWRRYGSGSWLHKIAVLLGFIESSTFEYFYERETFGSACMEFDD